MRDVDLSDLPGHPRSITFQKVAPDKEWSPKGNVIGTCTVYRFIGFDRRFRNAIKRDNEQILVRICCVSAWETPPNPSDRMEALSTAITVLYFYFKTVLLQYNIACVL